MARSQVFSNEKCWALRWVAELELKAEGDRTSKQLRRKYWLIFLSSH